MSQSKKYPIYVDKKDKFYKRLSNKLNRRWLETLTFSFKSTKLFKQQVNTYDICDWKFDPRNTEDAKKASRK